MVLGHLYPKDRVPPTMEPALCWFIEHGLLRTITRTEVGELAPVFQETCRRMLHPSPSTHGWVQRLANSQWRWLRKEAITLKWGVHSVYHGWDSKQCAKLRAACEELENPLKHYPVLHIPKSVMRAALRSVDYDVIDLLLFSASPMLGAVLPAGATSEVDEICEQLATIIEEMARDPGLKWVLEDCLWMGPLKVILETERNEGIERYCHAPRRGVRASECRSTDRNAETLRAIDGHLAYLSNLCVELDCLAALKVLYRFDTTVSDIMKLGARAFSTFYRPMYDANGRMDIICALESGGGVGFRAAEQVHVDMMRALILCRDEIFLWLYTKGAGRGSHVWGQLVIEPPEKHVIVAKEFAYAIRRGEEGLAAFKNARDSDNIPVDFGTCYCVASQHSRDAETGRAVWAGPDRADYYYVRWLQDRVAATPSSHTMIKASSSGNTRLLRDIKSIAPSMLVPWECAYMAAFYGYYETFLWLVRHGCAWNEIRIASMLRGFVRRSRCESHRRILAWIHENGSVGPGVEHMRVGGRGPDDAARPLRCPPDCDSDDEGRAMKQTTTNGF